MMLVPLLVVVAGLTPARNPSTIDLDGDHMPDQIRLDCPRGASEYTLSINDAVYVGRGEVLEGTFSIVDVDSTDGFHEIAVPQEGPSDDYATYLHRYDGTTIHLLGVLPGTYDLKIDGSGRVVTDCRGSVLQTWFYSCVYRLTGPWKLEKVRGELYRMGTKCRLKFALPLQASRTSSTIVAVPQAGDSVVIEASDDSTWCLVSTPQGVLGWFRLSGYDTVEPLGVRGSDVFDGLSYAD